MKKKKILLIFGTRPEAIKMAPLVIELCKNENFETKVCVTAQHRQMLDQVLTLFKIEPDYDLDIMLPNQTLTQVMSRALIGLETVVNEFKPGIILVHGDTSTTFAGALIAYYHKIKLGHVEAGLRTFEKFSPFPEEINRQFVGLVADYHFAPTEMSKLNLEKAGVDHQSIFVTGNTAIDALKYTINDHYHHPLYDWIGENQLILLTAHRRENLGNPMREIFLAVKKIVEEFNDVKVIYPIHLNPQIRLIADEILGDNDNIKIIPPLDVFDFHNFMKKSYIILTDSGGIQEEAPSLGKPVLVLRDTTERPEGVSAGTLKLVGTNSNDIYTECKRLLTDKSYYNTFESIQNPYGDGHAAEKIVRILSEVSLKENSD